MVNWAFIRQVGALEWALRYSTAVSQTHSATGQRIASTYRLKNDIAATKPNIH